jgi:NAD-dependent DNA ligase
MEAEEVGPEVAASVTSFADRKNRESVERLKKAGVQVIEPKAKKESSPTRCLFSPESFRRMEETSSKCGGDLGGKNSLKRFEEGGFRGRGRGSGFQIQKAKQLGIRILTRKHSGKWSAHSGFLDQSDGPF